MFYDRSYRPRIATSFSGFAVVRGLHFVFSFYLFTASLSPLPPPARATVPATRAPSGTHLAACTCKSQVQSRKSTIQRTYTRAIRQISGRVAVITRPLVETRTVAFDIPLSRVPESPSNSATLRRSAFVATVPTNSPRRFPQRQYASKGLSKTSIFGQVDESERYSLDISSSFPRPRGVTPFI